MTLTHVQARTRDLGGFEVRRILPAIGRKMVGPFIFLDRMGPASFPAGQGIDVRPHPHIGLATVTFLFEGAIMHRDSVGSAQVIRPGDVNWRTAGKGIVHSERTPPEERARGGKLDGMQCWVALPLAHEDTAPRFVHHPGRTLPEVTREGVRIKVLVGNAFGVTSPVEAFGDLLYADLVLPQGARITVPAEGRELGAYAATGRISVNGEALEDHALAVGKPGEALLIEAAAESRVMVLGGTPFAEGREIWWNFVASSKDRLARAKADWAAQRFAKVPGDEVEFIPLPEESGAERKPAGTVM